MLNSLCFCFHSDYIWIEPVTGTEFDVAIGARVTSAEGRRIQVKDDDSVEQWLTPERRIKAMHASSVQGVEDMISLGDLHEAGILRNLLIRYNDNLIYVSSPCTHKVLRVFRLRLLMHPIKPLTSPSLPPRFRRHTPARFWSLSIRIKFCQFTPPTRSKFIKSGKSASFRRTFSPSATTLMPT